MFRRFNGFMMNKLRGYFISGLIAFLPLMLTINLLLLAFNFADRALGKYIEPYFSREFGFYFRGLSILLCLVLILILGFFVNNFLGRKIYLRLERLLLNLPFFKQIYPALKEISLFVFSKKRMNFRQVVLVEYPRKGIFSMGFLTNETHKKIVEKTPEKELCNVFVPHTPSPFGGFMIMAPKKDLIFLAMPVEEAIKIIVSGGVIKSAEDVGKSEFSNED